MGEIVLSAKQRRFNVQCSKFNVGRETGKSRDAWCV